jgi:selenocysteine lyase/cysteine desulfurase
VAKHGLKLSARFTKQSVGDLMPARELCKLAREKGVLSLVDGAQSLGLIEVNLAEMQPDFYTSSAHKWPCGPKEVGVLYINKTAQSLIWPGIVSAFPGATGISKSFESFGQRDEPAIMAFGEALKFQTKIGRKVIEARSRELARPIQDCRKSTASTMDEHRPQALALGGVFPSRQSGYSEARRRPL